MNTDCQDFKLRNNNICVYLQKSVSYIIGCNVRFEQQKGKNTNEG